MIRVLVLLLLVWVRTSLAASATQIVLPTAFGGVALAMSAVANQLRCAVVIMPFSITGATKLTFGVIGVGGSCSVGLYPNSDSGSILLSSIVSCTVAGAKVGTSSAANLVAGTAYRLCTCSSSTATTMAAVEEFGTAGMNLSAVLNASTTRMGTGTACTAGALAPTTGALTPVASVKVPVVVIE